MRSFVKTVFAAAAFACVSPAFAAVVFCSGSNCTPTNENVLIQAQTTTVLGSPISGLTNSSNVGVTFTSATDVLVGSSNGQASVSSADGLLNSLTFALASGFGFSGATFNPFPMPGNAASEATSLLVSYTTTAGSGSQVLPINTNGQNFLGIFVDAGELITSVTFSGNPGSTGVQDLRQLRLNGVQAISAVPEPASWALMILGFGLVGAASRRMRGATLVARPA